MNLSFSSNLKRLLEEGTKHNLNSNTNITNNTQNNPTTTLLNKAHHHINILSTNPNINSIKRKHMSYNNNTKHEMVSDLEGFLNKTNNMNGSNIKQEMYSDIDDNNLFTSNIPFNDVGQIKESGGIKESFFSTNNRRS